MFWPRTIWGCYGRSLDDFKLPENRAAALRCLNHMVGGGGPGARARGVRPQPYGGWARGRRVGAGGFAALPRPHGNWQEQEQEQGVRGGGMVRALTWGVIAAVSDEHGCMPPALHRACLPLLLPYAVRACPCYCPCPCP